MKKNTKPFDAAREFTAAEFGQKLKQLAVINEVFKDFLAAIERAPGKSLAMHNAKSLERGLLALASASSAMQKSIWRFEAGQPLEPGEFKPRSPAKTETKNHGEPKPRTKRAKPLD